MPRDRRSRFNVDISHDSQNSKFVYSSQLNSLTHIGTEYRLGYRSNSFMLHAQNNFIAQSKFLIWDNKCTGLVKLHHMAVLDPNGHQLDIDKKLSIFYVYSTILVIQT